MKLKSWMQHGIIFDTTFSFIFRIRGTSCKISVLWVTLIMIYVGSFQSPVFHISFSLLLKVTPTVDFEKIYTKLQYFHCRSAKELELRLIGLKIFD